MSAQGIIKNFDFPIRNNDGKLQYSIKGEQAKPLANGQYELKKADATIYSQDGKNDSHIKMDSCLLDPNTKEIETEGPVFFEMPGVKIQGVGMDGSLALDGDGLVIKNNVRVEITDMQKGVTIVKNNE
ncbi:MAG: hypothetical protein SGI98_08615 [Verrucomicrobiota bacterium]|nr:hypothetical protein [Verrucomicrobiota bacterium]